MTSSVSNYKQQVVPRLLVLVSAVLAVGAYSQALDYPFISDDISYVVTNKSLAGLRWSDLWQLLLRPYTVGLEFLPLRDLSYWIDMTLFGQNPAAYRLHNILLYLLCLPLLYAVVASLWRYFLPGSVMQAPWAAAAVTALFAVHPALVESVVWISGRKYILPDFFSLLAIWLAVKTRQGQGWSSHYAAATLAAFVGVMFSKSSYVGIAPIIAMLWLRFWQDIPPQQKSRLLLLWPLSLMLLAAVLLEIFIVHNNGFDTIPPYYGTEAITRSLAILGGLARISVSLGGRHFFYPVFEDPWLPAMVILGVAVLLAAIWGGGMFLRRRSLAGFLILAFLLLCLPYLQLVPAKPPTLVADRYVSLAIWPVVMLLVMLVWRIRMQLRVLVLLATALPWFYQTVEHAKDWRSFGTLMAADLRAYPGYYMPVFSTMVNDEIQKGLYGEASDTASRVTSPEIREAMLGLIRIDHLRITSNQPQELMASFLEYGRTLERQPAETQWNAPALFIWMKLRDTLGKEWKFLAEEFPANALVRYNTGVYMINLHDYDEAERHLRVAAQSEVLPETLRGTAYLNLGIIYMNEERFAESKTMFLASLAQRRPDDKAYCFLEKIYRQEGRQDEMLRAASSCPALP